MCSNIEKLINTDRLIKSFIEMAKFGTGVNEDIAENQTPSSPEQRLFAQSLEKKLTAIGLNNVNLDNHCILTATLESNIGDNVPVIGLIAHMDTSPDAPNTNVKPIIHDYKDGNLELNAESVISSDDLKKFINSKIITSDGNTLLGADDKAGVAEIIEAVTVLIEHPEIKHPKIRIAFTPDEETGTGVKSFNIKEFGADLAYTIDGDDPKNIESSTFNAFNPIIKIKGKNTHPGYAYKKMINSIEIANEFINKIPKSQTPSKTRNKQGYFHIADIKGSEEETTINMLVRDFDYKTAQKRIAYLKEIAKKLQTKHKGCTIDVLENEKYRNMEEYIKQLPEVTNYAKVGIKKTGITPEFVAIRGGTDGSQLSINGLLTPNLGAGGRNFHSRTEFLPVNDMKKCTENIINIISVWAENSSIVIDKLISRRASFLK